MLAVWLCGLELSAVAALSARSSDANPANLLRSGAGAPPLQVATELHDSEAGPPAWAKTPARLSKTSCPHGVAFISDIEGDEKFWESWKAHAQKKGAVVGGDSGNIGGGGPRVGDGWCIVNGGDTVDKGEGSLLVLRELLSLKESAPCRVGLILGNRDLNKIRLVRELHLPAAERATFKPWLGFKDADTYGAAAVRASPDDDVSFLKWIQSKTMGAGGDFERRRAELHSAGGSDDDGAVLKSYHDQGRADECTDAHYACRDGMGLMYLYLRAGQTVISSSDMASIFVHGGLGSENLFKTWPDDWDAPTTKKTASTVDEWVENEWKWKNELMDRAYGSEDPEGRDAAISMLAEAALGNRLHGAQAAEARDAEFSTFDNVVNVRSANFKTNQMKDADFFGDESVQDRLTESKIANIVVGHTPRGILPDAKVFVKEKGIFSVINGDVSCNRPNHHVRIPPDADRSESPDDHPAGAAPWIRIHPGGKWVVKGSVPRKLLALEEGTAATNGVLHYKISEEILTSAEKATPSPASGFKRCDIRAKVVTSSVERGASYVFASTEPEEGPSFLINFGLMSSGQGNGENENVGEIGGDSGGAPLG